MPKPITNTCTSCSKARVEMTRVYTNLLRILRADLTLTTDPAKIHRLRHGIDAAKAFLTSDPKPCRYATMRSN